MMKGQYCVVACSFFGELGTRVYDFYTGNRGHFPQGKSQQQNGHLNNYLRWNFYSLPGYRFYLFIYLF